MLRASDATLGPAIAWLLVCLAGWLSVHRWAGAWPQAHPRLLIMASAAVARVIPAVALDRGLPFDIEAHWWVGSLTLAGQDVYASVQEFEPITRIAWGGGPKSSRDSKAYHAWIITPTPNGTHLWTEETMQGPLSPG